MRTLVLLRHGESEWNKENRFTGWVDVDLSVKGVEEAREAGRRLKAAGHRFDVAFTSYLKRAIRTLWLAMEGMEQMWLPVQTSWRLNERHYGGLTGLDKAETARKYGDAQVKIWRRSYDTPPPLLARDDPANPAGDARYAALAPAERPVGESLADTVTRFLPCWHSQIAPALQSGQRVLVAAHGNSLRALVMYLDRMSPAEILEVNIPTGVPLVYELGDDLKPVRSAYLEASRNT